MVKICINSSLVVTTKLKLEYNAIVDTNDIIPKLPLKSLEKGATLLPKKEHGLSGLVMENILLSRDSAGSRRGRSWCTRPKTSTASTRRPWTCHQLFLFLSTTKIPQHCSYLAKERQPSMDMKLLRTLLIFSHSHLSKPMFHLKVELMIRYLGFSHKTS